MAKSKKKVVSDQLPVDGGQLPVDGDPLPVGSDQLPVDSGQSVVAEETIVMVKGSARWECRADETARIEHLKDDGFVVEQ